MHLLFQIMLTPSPTEEKLTTCARDVQNIGAIATSIGIGAYIHSHSLDVCGSGLDAVALGHRVRLDLVRGDRQELRVVSSSLHCRATCSKACEASDDGKEDAWLHLDLAVHLK